MDLYFGKGVAENSGSTRYACVAVFLQAHMHHARTGAVKSDAIYECKAARQKAARFYSSLSDRIGVRHLSVARVNIPQGNAP
jgi:hypothetical protein